MVLSGLFILVLFGIWLFLVGATKSHVKLADKTEKFIKENLVDEDKKENV